MIQFLVPGSIVDRLWGSFIDMVKGRIQSSAPVTVSLLQGAEKAFLGTTDDLTVNPVVQDVFHAMRIAGLVLLAFCTVISLAELAETSITGQGGNLVGWFKRFFVSTLMTFGGLQFYGLWMRLFNGLIDLFRGYLDTHWSGAGDTGNLFLMIVDLITGSNILLVLAFVMITVLVLFILWFLVGGVRKAELILSLVIAPVVWPLYMIQSVEDIPKTAFRGFLGLNAMLLFTVAMVRIAIRLAVNPIGGLSIWNLVPSLAMLVFCLFLPATIRRIVGQGQPGVGALVTAVQMAAGMKLLSLGAAAAGAKAVSPPASGAVPQAPSGPSSYPLATVPPAGMSGYQGSGPGGPSTQPRSQAARAIVAGAAEARPISLAEPIPTSELVMDIHESEPGSGQFDTLGAFGRFQEGVQDYRRQHHEDEPKPGGDS